MKKTQGEIHFIYSRGLNNLPNDVDLRIHDVICYVEQKKIQTTNKILIKGLCLCDGNHVSS